jgi:hypothetical protein
MADPSFSVQRAVQPEEASPNAPSVPLVSSLPRWAVSSLAGIAALVAANDAILVLSHVKPTLAMFTRVLAFGAPAIMVIVFALLRAEESRLARELRTVRTGTAMLRSLIVGRQQLPFLTRWSTTKLGTAAVLLADGDRFGATEALRTSSVFMRVGGLEKLRSFVEADVERSAGAGGLDRCIDRLRNVELTGNREADLYRLHVLVKAVLAKGDADTGDELARELGGQSDEERVYATWLRVWFELDAPMSEADGDEGGEPWPPLTEGDLRIAILAARPHGAEQLIAKLAERLSAIAHPGSRE